MGEQPQIPEKKRCRAMTLAKRERCKKRKVLLSKYCWHHQPWGTNLISGGIAFVLGFLTNVLSSWVMERSADLHPVVGLNQLQRLERDTVIVYPSNTPPSEIDLMVHNEGKVSANGFVIALSVPTAVTNVVDLAEWQAKGAVWTGGQPLISRYTISVNAALAPKVVSGLPAIRLNTNHINAVVFFLMTATAGMESKEYRLHLVFKNPDGVTNVYHGKSAKRQMRGFAPDTADNLQLGWYQLK